MKKARPVQRVATFLQGFSSKPRSNISNWKNLQEGGYFENHPCYGAFSIVGGEFDAAKIAEFFKLQAHHIVVNVGCGYGREALHIAPKVRHVYGIDVSGTVLKKTVAFLAENGVSNFTPVEAERYRSEIPDRIDFVYCIVVMQHLTRDLARDYIKTLGERLAPDGRMLIQFIHELFDGVEDADAILSDHEPSISWTLPQLVQMTRECRVEIEEVRSLVATPTCLWHWAFLKKAAT